MLESQFQKTFLNKLKNMLGDIVIMKNDPTYIQGIPDYTILVNDKWICLEFKKNKKASFRPNQKYYIDKLNKIGFCVVVYPENENEVLYEIQQAFRF